MTEGNDSIPQIEALPTPVSLRRAVQILISWLEQDIPTSPHEGISDTETDCQSEK